MKSSTPEWQANLLRRLTGLTKGTNKTVPERLGWSWERVPNWRLFLTSAGLVALSAAIVVLLISNRQPSIERMLSDAYAENGTLEIQIPGAPHTVSKATRGKGKSGVERPALAATEVRIARELALSPGNPAWLQAKGRVELLEGNPKAALDSFERARDISPELPS